MYALHDLSEVKMAKWKTRDSPVSDGFDVLDLNPLEHYRVCGSLLPCQKYEREANDVVWIEFLQCPNKWRRWDGSNIQKKLA
jgi:hypothetical protein